MIGLALKTLRALGVTLVVIAAGVICGSLARRIGGSHDPAVDSRARTELKSAAPHAESPPPQILATDASSDFAARLKALAGTGNPSKRLTAIAGVADELDGPEIIEALNLLEKGSVRDGEEIRWQLLSRWAELDPEAALEYAQGLPNGFEAPGAIEAVIKSWAAIDAKGAEEGVARMTESFVKELARAALLPALSEIDPRHAYATLRDIMPFYSDDIGKLFQNWAEKDPTEAATYAATLRDRQLRSFALRDVAQKWAEIDHEAAATWALSFQPENPSGVTIEGRDPRPVATALQTWMSKDADGALQWLEQLPGDAMKNDVLAALSRSLSDEEPEHAVEVAAMMPAGKTQERALQHLIGTWGQKDFGGALAWAHAQPEAAIREILLPRLANDLASRDPAAALQLATTVAGEAGAHAVANVLRTWAQKEPAAAAEWAGGQPDNQKYLASVASAWAEKNRSNALAWANTIPTSEEKDAALASGVRMVAQSDQPQSAEEWVIGMSSEEKRAAAYQELAFWWLRADQKKAREWLKTAPLSDKAKEDLRKAAPK